MTQRRNLLNICSSFGKMKLRPPVMPPMKPKNSKPEGIVQVLKASAQTRSTLLISTKAATGPAGPREKAVWMNVFPIVSKILPANPIRNSFLSKPLTDRQYHVTPRIKTRKLEVQDVPKLMVLASKLYLGEVTSLVKNDWPKKKQGVMKPQRIASPLPRDGSLNAGLNFKSSSGFFGI